MFTLTVRQTADADCREYHGSEELTEAPYWQVLNSELGAEGNFSKFGSQAASLLKAMNGTEGIVKLTLRPHSIKVTKEASATWPEVEPNIISAFETTFGQSRVIYYSRATRERVPA